MCNEEELAKIISFSREIESILKDKFKAKGKGLHTYIDSIENMLNLQLVKDLRYIATIRNKAMHESTFKMDNLSRYKMVSERTILSLNKLEIKNMRPIKQKKGSFNTLLFIIVLIVAGFLYQSTNNTPQEKEPFSYQEDIAVEKEYKKPSLHMTITSKNKNRKDNYKIATKPCLAFNNMKHTKNKGNISLKSGYEYKIMKSQNNQLRIFIDYLSEQEVPHRWVDSHCFQ